MLWRLHGRAGGRVRQQTLGDTYGRAAEALVAPAPSTPGVARHTGLSSERVRQEILQDKVGVCVRFACVVRALCVRCALLPRLFQ